MSTRYNNGSHYENHPAAAEARDHAEHEHIAAGQHGQEEHLTAHEQSRHALEHGHEAHHASNGGTTGHGIAAFGHNDIAALAHELWQAKGCPEGSADEDWAQAVKELRCRTVA